MSAEQNKTIIRRFFDELWNARKLEVADEIFAPECVTHQLISGAETVAAPRDADAVKAHVGEWLKGFPDLRFTIEQMLGEGDEVVTFATMHGTHSGDWHGLAATGKSVNIKMTVTHRIQNEKIVADWVLVEALGFFQQLGLLPPTPDMISGVAE
ncbi:MAG TPA: ester cyclase [Pyrinomonadaceae bacterium]|jgi:predicted ester cyclase